MKLFALLLILSGSLSALPTDTYFEIRQSGSDSNGGCYSVANQVGTSVNYSYPSPSPISLAGTLSGTGTLTLTASVASFDNTMPGNCVAISGQGLFMIKTFTDSTHVSVTSLLGTFSGATGIVGGAMATPGFVCGQLAGNNVGWIQYDASAFTMTSTSNVAGGRCSMPSAGTIAELRGYDVTRGDRVRKPTLQASGSGVTLITSASGNTIDNLILDCNSQTTSRGINHVSVVMYVKVMNCSNTGILMDGGILFFSEITGVTGGTAALLIQSTAGNVVSFCEIHDNSLEGISAGTNGTSLNNNLVYGNNGNGIDISSQNVVAINNTVYNNVGHGFNLHAATADHATLINNIAEGNTGTGHFGFNCSSACSGIMFKNAAYNNAAGDYSTNFSSDLVFNFISYTSTAFVNAGAGNFSLNNNNTGGRLLIATGFPTTSSTGGSANFPDIGAIQTRSASVAMVVTTSAQ